MSSSAAGSGQTERRCAAFYRRTPIVTLSESAPHLERLRLPAERLHVVPPGATFGLCPDHRRRHSSWLQLGA